MKLQALLREFSPSQFVPSLTAGLVVGTTVVLFLSSLAALIFSGRLSPFVADGIGLLLFGSMALGLAVAFFNSLPGAIPVVQDSPAAIFALAAASIAAQVPAGASPQQLYFTVVAALSLTTILTGILFLVIGRFGLSSFVRFVPYPVVGGFLAGAGWLLAQGALGVMSGLPMRLADLPRLFQPDILIRWLPGAVLAVLLVVLLRRFEHPLLMGGMLLGGIVIFYAILFATGTSAAEAAERGLLLGPFPSQSLWRPLQISQLALVDWPLLLTQTGKLVTILLVSSISLLLNMSALELATRRDIDINRELYAAGIGNLLGGLGGSPAGYQAISTTMLAHRMGGRSRLATLVIALLCGAAMLFGASLLSFFPKAVIGGLLLYLGLSFLVEWVYDAWKRLPRTDYFLVLVILGIVSALGFLQGVGAGILIAVILFVINYSRLDFVKNTLTGLSYHSRRERPAEHRALLLAAGGGIHILRLQGYLFFGTAQNLLNRIRERLNDPEQPSLRFLILDFQHVPALDSSAVLGFVRLGQMAEANQVQLVVTHLNPEVRERLARGGLVEGQAGTFHIFSTLDHGMEWCEDQLLSPEALSVPAGRASLYAQLEEIFSSPEQIERFMGYLEMMQVDRGHILMRQGDPSSEMYFVDSGQVTAQLETSPGKSIRLASMGAGTVIGEMALYLQQRRTATVFVTSPGVVYRLTKSALKELEQNHPEAAALLHEWMVRLLARRLSDNNRTLEVLLD